MVVGVLRLRLRIPENDSLKGKRRVLRQIIDRLRGRFELAVAETGLQDSHQDAELGLACISSDRRVCNAVLDQAAAFVESLGTVWVTLRELELINL